MPPFCARVDDSIPGFVGSSANVPPTRSSGCIKIHLRPQTASLIGIQMARPCWQRELENLSKVGLILRKSGGQPGFLSG